jgi:hypothetical protein
MQAKPDLAMLERAIASAKQLHEALSAFHESVKAISDFGAAAETAKAEEAAARNSLAAAYREIEIRQVEIRQLEARRAEA